MNDRTVFWLNVSRWPRDSASHIFLARAVQAFGSAMFPATWEAKDPSLKLIPPLPEQTPKQQSGHDYRAHQLLVLNRPEFGRKNLTLSQRGTDWPRIPMQIPPFSKDEWSAAQKFIEDHNKEALPGFSRVSAVQQKIINLAEAGRLVSAIRQKAGGTSKELPSWIWNSERILNRFHFCELDPDEPFGLASSSNQSCFLFVTKVSLADCLSELQPKAKQTVNLQRECQRWLEEQFALPETERWSKATFQKETANRFGAGLGARMFQRAWAAAVEKPRNQNRQRAGAKSKSDL